jgi:hypothetical protein
MRDTGQGEGFITDQVLVINPVCKILNHSGPPRCNEDCLRVNIKAFKNYPVLF